MKQAFTPFDETKDPKYLTWKGEDTTDKMIPDLPGFITDFVYSTRGREVASSYAVWGALYMISSVLQRDVAFVPPNGDPWTDRDYLNLYMLFIGPAGSGKTATINIIDKILTGCNIKFNEATVPEMRRKEFAVISDVSTPEAFLGSMASHSSNLSANSDGSKTWNRKIYTGGVGEAEVKAWSNCNALLSEFASLVNKKKYNDSMSTNLLTLYDSPESFTWNTVSRGNVRIPDVFLNILGASTADGMTSNVDPKTLEDGFMSRMLMVYVPDYLRKRAFRWQTSATFATIRDRLMWIAENTKGNYKLTKDAEAWFFKWYDEFMDKMNKSPEKAGYMIRNRTLILKVAILLCISEYKNSHNVEIRHLELADRLIQQTYRGVSDLIRYFSDAQIGAAKRALEAQLVKAKGGLLKKELASRITRFTVETLDGGLKSLWMEGKIIVINDSNEEKEAPSFYPNERYSYVRITHEPEDDAERRIFKQRESPVFTRDTGIENSEEDGPEPMDDIPGLEEIWSGHFPRDKGKEA